MQIKTIPFTITNRIAGALGLPEFWEADDIQLTRYKAVAEIISSFLNDSEKNDPGQQGFFAGMIIRILLPNVRELMTDKSVHFSAEKYFSDMQTVISIIQEGDKTIQEEQKQAREDWFAARKAENELVTA